ncbi:MAG: hypothetical protein AB1563_07365 [Bacillota bacterium]
MGPARKYDRIINEPIPFLLWQQERPSEAKRGGCLLVTSEVRDVRDELFSHLLHTQVTAVLTTEQDGVAVGLLEAAEAARSLGLKGDVLAKDGSVVKAGQPLLRVQGTPKGVVMTEDIVIGIIAKPSGIATAARAAAEAAGGTVEVVAGAWKKVPPECKKAFRTAALLGGLRTRIAEHPFVYLDKNYVRILGGVVQALEAARRMEGRTLVVQLKGETGPIDEEAVEAAHAGAAIVMIDTGNENDLREVICRLEKEGLRRSVKVAFAGGIRIEDIGRIGALGADIVDIGTAIVDAPMMQLRFDVISVS